MCRFRFSEILICGYFATNPKKEEMSLLLLGKTKKKEIKWLGTTLLIIVLPTQSMQLFVGTDCAIAMKKPNNTKSCSYCSAREGGRQGGREGGASRGLSRRRRRRGLKKKAKNYAKTGPTFAVATANTETKECAQKQTVAAAAPCSVLCCLPPTPLKNGRKKKPLPLCSSVFW